MKKDVNEKEKSIEKWANLVFAFFALSAVLVSLALIWVNQ
jgi:hypothetical protein